MTHLYGCKRTQDRETFLIAKFDDQLIVQSSYFVGPRTCQCPQWSKRGQCRHLTIRAMFMSNHHCDDGWFLDFDNRRWREYPQLMVDGSVGDFKERFDALAIGDGGIQPIDSSATAKGGLPSADGAGGLSLSSPAPAPEVEHHLAPSGASDLGATAGGNQPPLASDGGIKRRKGL